MTTGAHDAEPLSADVPNVNADNPWLGLASFTEGWVPLVAWLDACEHPFQTLASAVASGVW